MAVSKYYSALSLDTLKRREILNKILNVTNEEDSLMEILELMGRFQVTADPVFTNHINEELSTNITVTATDNTVATAPLVTVSAGDFAKIRPGEIVICPNKKVGYIKATASYGAVTLSANQFQLISIDNTALSLAATNKLSVFSNASGEGSSGPATRRYGVTAESNQIHIFKEAYAATDIQMASKTSFDYNGQPYYFLHEQAETLRKFFQAISAGILFSRQSTDTFVDTPSGTTVTDTDGNIVSTTKGINQYCEEGISFGATGVSKATFATMARAYAAARAGDRHLLLHGVNFGIGLDDFLKIPDSGVLASGMRYDISEMNPNFSLESFRLYDNTFIKKRLGLIDSKTLINFTGSAGYQNRAWLIPLDKVKTSDKGLLDRLLIRYMQVPVANQINVSTDPRLMYRELRLGGYADGVATSSESKAEYVYEANLGVQVLGKQHFAVLDLS